MIPIEITVGIVNDDTSTLQATVVAVVQLPCVPANGIMFERPDELGVELELEGVAYSLRKQMFYGSLEDYANDDELDGAIERWRQAGFVCDWRASGESTE